MCRFVKTNHKPARCKCALFVMNRMMFWNKPKLLKDSVEVGGEVEEGGEVEGEATPIDMSRHKKHPVDHWLIIFDDLKKRISLSEYKES